MAVAQDKIFKALADPTRRALFERMARGGEHTVHVLTERSGVSQPAVSKHLGILKRARMVRVRRAGRETHYSVQPKALAPLVDWMSIHTVLWDDAFDRLEAVLKDLDAPSANRKKPSPADAQWKRRHP